MKKIKKRGAVYGVVALLLCTAAYLNWSYVEPPADLLQTDGNSADSAAAIGRRRGGGRGLFRVLASDERKGA